MDITEHEIIVNGARTQCFNNCTLEDYLAQAGFRTDRIAVELNGDIIPKSKYPACVLHSGDILEVVTFVGGG